MEMIFSWLKYRNNFISRSVRKQNMEWSNGVIFLIATFCPEGLCKAELETPFRQPPILSILAESFSLLNSPNNTISSFSYHVLYIILLRNIERDLARTCGIRRSRHCAGCRPSSVFERAVSETQICELRKNAEICLVFD